MPEPTTSRTTRPRFVVATLMALIAILLVSLLAPPEAHAQSDAQREEASELAAEGLVTIDSVDGGALLLATNRPGWYVPAPMLHTDIDITVSGPLARTTLTQHFRNAASVFVEGKYVFPLPEGAAVDTLRMKVEDRWVEGQIETKQEARQIFETAKAAGQVASLVEQLRPNVFTTAVANIAPDATVVIQIEFQQALAPRDGTFGLRMPLVVAPRYNHVGQGRPVLELGRNGWAIDPRTPAAPPLDVPVTDPRNDDPATTRNPVKISIDLEAGFPLGDVQSLYHDVSVDRRHESAATIEVTGAVPADRDFYLSWRALDLDAPYAAAFTEHRENQTHYIAMLTPPGASAIGDQRPPREVIFVQDVSGSMSGESIVQARAGLTEALEGLRPADHFNIIAFNSTFETFSKEPVVANNVNVAQAARFINRLQAEDGTEMYRPLDHALTDTTPGDGRLRQVIFLTDGAVSNESQLLSLIEEKLGKSRLFTVGIGSAPNSYFMTAAATAGRGSHVFIGSVDEVSTTMETLASKIESPAVVDLAVGNLPDGAEVSPWPIPDLYAGDPIALTVRIPEFSEGETLELTGSRGDEPWSTNIDLINAPPRRGVSKLWAREHIRDLEAQWHSPLVDNLQRDEIDAKIRTTALEFGLVSRLTSLVAADVEITRPADAPSASTDVPTNLPAGWDPASFFIGETNNSDVVVERFDDKLTRRLTEAVDIRAETAVVQVAFGPGLPATGADWQLHAMFGLALLTIGGVVHALDRRRLVA